jgi:HPt (histidine-containing phosphotransfer) domain-containing protein
MFADVANEFENITKFELLQYFTDYSDFLQNDYSEVYAYYSGNSESIDNAKLTTLSTLLNKSNNLMRIFQEFAGKLGNVGYWELQQYCQDLKDTLERISKLPKYCRTAKTCRGYKPYVQVNEDIGGMKTIADLADQLGNITENELILNNDLEEGNYEIDKLSSITALVENQTNVVVSTIMEQPIGKRIYGKDIQRKIDFSDNDLTIVKYENNVEQKAEILLEINKGDVPEIPNFGKTVVSGQTYSGYNYGELMSDLQDNFLQDDLFDNVTISDIDYDNGDLYATVKIQTKYVYSTTKNMKI